MSKTATKVAARFLEAAAGYVIGPRGLEKPEGTEVTLMEGAAYYLGASSSPQFIILTDVSDKKVKFKTYPFTGSETHMERWIAADLIARGTKQHLSTYGRYMEPDLKRSMESLLKGGRGRKEKLDDYRPVTVLLGPSEAYKGEDLWRAAEEWGGVSGLEKDGVMLYEVNTEKRNVEKMKNDRRFEVLEVKNR